MSENPERDDELLEDEGEDKGKSKSKKPTQDQLDERISFVVRLLARRAYKHEIYNLLKRRYNVNASTAQRYVSRAREIIAENAGRTRTEHRVDAFTFYTSIIRDPEAKLSERMWAQARIDSLFGLQEPVIQRHQHGGDPEGVSQEHVVVYIPSNGRDDPPADTHTTNGHANADHAI